MSNIGDEVEGNFHIQNYVNFSIVKYLVDKGLIDIDDFRESMRESEHNLRKGLDPDVTQKFSNNISSAFDAVSMGISNEE